ncbi:MAG: hypothetical protein IPN16_00805 [Gemmatimonadetes bacterium]|nr:hypothetical protein [Gemmatimonadota bacterium]
MGAATLHGAAPVRPADGAPCVLVVATRGLPDETTGPRRIEDISRLVWGHATARWGAP